MGPRPGVFSRRLGAAKVFKLVLNAAEEPTTPGVSKPHMGVSYRYCWLLESRLSVEDQ